MLDCEEGGTGTTVSFNLLVDGNDVVLRGPGRDPERRGDLLVALTTGHQVGVGGGEVASDASPALST